MGGSVKGPTFEKIFAEILSNFSNFLKNSFFLENSGNFEKIFSQKIN